MNAVHVSILLLIIGSVLGVVSKHIGRILKSRNRIQMPATPGTIGFIQKKEINIGLILLVIFAFIVLTFGIFSIFLYWENIIQNKGLIIYAIWLLLVMILGMFVQVLSTNYLSDKKLFKVTWPQLVFPLLFAPIVFYPIWTFAESASRSLFVFYSAFLNGYFWERVVSSAKPSLKE